MRLKQSKTKKHTKRLKQNRKHRQISKLTGGNNLKSPITEYYYYSSHNTELITMQINGTCSSCVIQDFINNTYSIGGCIEFDLRLVNYNARTISIDHYCSGKGLDFETVLTQIISLYGNDDYKGVKYPLIISIDANGISEPANKSQFADLWNEILARCFAGDYSKLRPDIEVTSETKTKMDDIMGKILFRWAYNDTSDIKKNLHKSPETTNHISRINITKNITISKPVLKGKKTIISSETSKSKLVRLYPKTPIIQGAFNYNFTYYILQGVQICAMNLGHNDKYTHAYNEFFKYDKVIHIPESICKGKQLQLNTELVKESENNRKIANTILECVTSDKLNEEINAILQQHTGCITPELNKEVLDLVSFYDACTQEEKGEITDYLASPKYFNTSDGTYTLSKINNIVHLSRKTTHAGHNLTESFVGGGGVSDTYSITLVDTTDITLKTAYNMFFNNNSSDINKYKYIYTHFTNDMNIFNILYMKVTHKGNIYIGCINLSNKSDINLLSEIEINLFRKTEYLKSIQEQSQIKTKKKWQQLAKSISAVSKFKTFKKTLTRKISGSPVANSRSESPVSPVANSSRSESPTLFINNSRPESPISINNACPVSPINNSVELETCMISPNIITVKVKLNKIELDSEV
jgi:hypothetical protein